MNRREVLASSALIAASAPLATNTAWAMAPSPKPFLTWMAFSRHLQWVTTPQVSVSQPRETGVQIGKTAAQIGFKAIDLTVRENGHVDPQYAADRLPEMVAGIRSTGVACDMITTDILDLNTPVNASVPGLLINPEDIIAAAAKAGIKHYRCNPTFYNTSATGPFGKAVRDQLDDMKIKLRAMEALNRKYNIQALYQTFSGGYHVSAVWDFLYAADGIDPNFIALNYDIGHLFGEGAAGAWRINLRAAQPYWGAMGVKDVTFVRGDGETPRPDAMGFVKAGKGLVPWQEFFHLLLQGRYAGTCEPQLEYEFNGVELGTSFWPQGLPSSFTPDQMMAEQKADLDYYKAQATAAGWTKAQQS